MKGVFKMVKKRLLSFILLVVMMVSVFTGCKSEQNIEKENDEVSNTTVQENITTNDESTDITCVSFNILGVDSNGYLPCNMRAGFLSEFLLQINADLIGLQEAGSHSFDWTKELYNAVCKDDVYAGCRIKDEEGFQTTTVTADGKTPNSAGLMILYRTDRFELEESGAQRYTSTEKQERYFQWAKLKDKKTGETVYMTNTHWSINWDSEGKESKLAGNQHRTKEANELRGFWENVVGDNLLFATGDYNCLQTYDEYQLLGQGIYKEANEVFEFKGRPLTHIDNCFINSERQDVLEYRFLEDKFEFGAAEYAYSDHQPLLVKVSYKK